MDTATVTGLAEARKEHPLPEPARPVVEEQGIYNIPEELYHSDPVPNGSLSSTGARRILPPSCPAKFNWERTHPVFKDEFDYGSAAHKVILGSGPEVVVIDHDDWRTKDAKDRRDYARMAGKIPVLAKDWAAVQAMRDALLAHPYASALFDPDRGGHAEQSMFWRDEKHGIWKRARLDWLPAWDGSRRLVVPDYKTTTGAAPASFAKAAGNYGYFQQADFYLSGIAALLGAVDARFVFVNQEKEPPYLVSVCELDDESLEAGHTLNDRASALFAKCTAEGHWPGYCDDEVALVSLPRWAMPREEW